MGQLTPEDFARMQREAKMRVAEMQKRSRYYADSSQQKNKAQKEESNTVSAQKPLPHPADETNRSAADLPAPIKQEMDRQEDPSEMFLLLFLSFLVCEQDRDLFLLLIYIMLE